MRIEFRPEGIFLPHLGLWLDPKVPCEAAWLSHAHSDHAQGLHGTAIGTGDTLALYANRWPDEGTGRNMLRLDYRESLAWREARLTAWPAGHILGAAQLLIECEGERIVYTGDIKLRPPLCGETTETLSCDRLIVESTFGLPVFHFLDRQTARERVVSFARESLADGAIPAFVGYPLGRGQEIVHVLCDAGIPTSVHGAIARYIPFYATGGYTFTGWEPYRANQTEGRALVVTQDMRPYLEASAKGIRIAYVSGWAMFASARTRSGADELIPYSDHADFEELLELVDRSGARQVDVVHGYAEAFAGILRDRGITAQAYGGSASQATLEEVEG
jgi:Cft2 family RNA processing exonuclease